MTNGDDGTREDGARIGERTSTRSDLAARHARAPRTASPEAEPTPDTDELDAVAEQEPSPRVPDRPSVLPPDIAAARTAQHRRTMEIPIVDARHPYGEDDEADPLVDEEHEPTATPHVVVERRAGLYVAISLLSVGLIAASALAAYLWHVSEEWEAQVAELTDVSYGLGDNLAAERASLVEAQQRIELLDDQLATSKDTVSRLQAENARWGDDAAFAQEQITQLEDLIATGTAATASLTRCIEAHDQLVTYLDTPDAVAPEEIEAFRTSVTDLCTEANRAAQQFRRAASA